MRRIVRIPLAVLLGLAVGVARADVQPSLKDAFALQEALQAAIQEAEPSIACILVSRSDNYRRLLGDVPPADSPGQLGGFDFIAARRTLRIHGDDPQQDPRLADLKKLDLADAAHVPESFGSGVVIDAKGLVLTNYHVVRDATKVFVRLPGEKGSYADIHAADPRSDLAVLRLHEKGSYKAIKLGDGGKVRKGQLVLTLANPFAAGFRDGSPSASWGIISNLRRRAPGNPREEERVRTLHYYGTLLQTDARLNLGCSGGALLDLKGELIGLTTAQAALSTTETAGGFAVPMDAALRRIVEVLKRGEEVEYGFLGVSLDRDNHRDRGVRILGVGPGSPAARAGLRADDMILSINGMPVHDNDELFLALGMCLAGSQAELRLQSPGGAVRTVTVTLAKFHVPEKLGRIIAANRPAAVRGLRVDFASVLPQVLRHAHVTIPVPSGVIVREVQPNSAAESAHLKVHDVITEVNGRPVGSPAEFYREAQKTAGPLLLKVMVDPNRPTDTRMVKIN
jgi:S1-C subfamily serine protease